jgi:hypothetical protein
MAARSGTCRKCGKKIRPSAKDMSVGAASRIHYWKHHRDVMLGKKKKPAKQKARR